MIGSTDGWVYQSDSFEIDPLMLRQFLGFLSGIGLILLMQRCSYEMLKISSIPVYLASIGLLIAVLFLGTGAEEGDTVRRWLPVSSYISLQPSEIAKIAQILLFATLFDRFHRRTDRLLLLILLLAIAAVPLFLVYEEPDLSTTLVLFALTAACFFAAGVPGYYILILVLLLSIGGFLIYRDAVSDSPRFLNPYQTERILAWLYPEDYALTTAYQSVQSRAAIASGGLWGKGLFHSSHMVPIPTTDFIFGIVGEELGFAGGVCMIFLYLILCVRILLIASRCQDTFGKIICAGVAVMICFQAAVHIGVTTAVLPNTGLPLPFVSYGLSSLIANMAGIGLVLRIHKENVDLKYRRFK